MSHEAAIHNCPVLRPRQNYISGSYLNVFRKPFSHLTPYKYQLHNSLDKAIEVGPADFLPTVMAAVV
jgi:hypothetical protein